ncbi:MAG: protein-glutamate O-methyltransferase [Nitrospinae bacterium]|nr:protein-glutamate O-methyltransferase [Nitrospinota bacterium]
MESTKPGFSATGPIDLTDREFQLFRSLIFEKSGITLNEGKKELVRTRLGSKIRKGGFGSFKDYYNHILDDRTGEELVTLLDAISTNLTSFFREINHFHYLRKNIIPEIMERKKNDSAREIRAWSAGCSSGEEPYSLAFTMADMLQNDRNWDVKLLATDISTKVLARAARGVYSEEQVKTVPKEMASKFFDRVVDDGDRLYKVRPEIKSLIQFKRFNLMTPTFPFRRGFDFIFCRNVMIYFDKPTQQTLINKYYGALSEGGYLMIGHSESLTGVQHRFKYMQPTIYRKSHS